jgi:pimeloyl-ACP methyl ester carboxylesterase
VTPRPPAKIYTALESRSALEYTLWNASRRLLEKLPHGDGHPVLVLPGFTAADGSTLQLRALLRRLGYRTYGWKLGNNLGPTPLIIRGLEKRLVEISDKEQQPVSIIGWSLGGIYARDLARQHPDLVRQVITLGSPIRMSPGDPSAASRLWETLQPLHDPSVSHRIGEPEHEQMPVPSTAVYTRSDGVVHWKMCLEAKSPTSESVEVLGSHCGLGFNPSVAIVVADRLSRDVGNWKRFRPPLWALGAFPRPTHWKPNGTRETHVEDITMLDQPEQVA